MIQASCIARLSESIKSGEATRYMYIEATQMGPNGEADLGRQEKQRANFCKMLDTDDPFIPTSSSYIVVQPAEMMAAGWEDLAKTMHCGSESKAPQDRFIAHIWLASALGAQLIGSLSASAVRPSVQPRALACAGVHAR